MVEKSESDRLHAAVAFLSTRGGEIHFTPEKDDSGRKTGRMLILVRADHDGETACSFGSVRTKDLKLSERVAGFGLMDAVHSIKMLIEKKEAMKGRSK